ncbi:MAG: hypothetical protein VB091_11925 [Christensenella sp.]|nr:hypothetical protein [Christensenella sp.]
MYHPISHGTKPRRTKRYLVGILVLVMVLAISATALADNGRGAGGSGGQPKLGGSPSQPPQGTPDPDDTTEDRQGQRGNGAQNAEQPGVNTDKIAKAIAALDDETLQASLTALLETYEDALEAKQEALDAKDTTNLSTLSSAVGAAKDALDAALEAAGVSTDDLYGVPEEANDGTGRMQNRPALDTTEISATIAALDDTDANKATLTSLLEAYQAALATQNAGDASKLTTQEMAQLGDATQKAELALEQALKNAGLADGPILQQNQRQIQVKVEASASPAPTFELNVVGDEPASTGTESTSLFSAFLAWLNNLVK